MKYKDYKKLINKISWNKAKKYNLNYKDLIGEANLIFVKCSKTFDINRNVKPSTYLYNCINKGLNNYINKEINYRKNKMDPELNDLIQTNFQCNGKNLFMEFTRTKFNLKDYNGDFSFFELSENSKMILDTIYSKKDITNHKNKITKEKLKTVLRKESNLSHQEIKLSFAEIKECLI